MWFGRVPEHWTICKFKSLIEKSNGGEVIDRSHWHEGDELLFTCQRDPMPSRFPGFPSHKRTKANDLLVTRNGTPYVHLPPEGAIYSNVVQRCSLKEGVFRKFVAQSLAVACETLNGEGYGVSIASFSFPKWCNLSLPVPPPDEQKNIVTYLEDQTAKIDRLMDTRRRQMALLKEQRAAVIQQSVTRGLNPNAPMKDSGLPWLGEIPAHWQVKKLRHHACVGNGSTPSRTNAAYWTSGKYPWLNSSVVNQGVVTEADQFVTEVALSECHLPMVQPESLLVGLTGEGRTRGMCALLKFEATINQHLAYVTITKGILPSYLKLLFTGIYSVLRAIGDGEGSTKGALTCENLKQLKFPLPSLCEQQEILDKVRVQTGNIDKTIFAYTRQLELLTEYRAALIHECVTGQRIVTEADYA